MIRTIQYLAALPGGVGFGDRTHSMIKLAASALHLENSRRFQYRMWKQDRKKGYTGDLKSVHYRVQLITYWPDNSQTIKVVKKARSQIDDRIEKIPQTKDGMVQTM